MTERAPYELRCGDCAKVMLELEAGSVDMVLTSPPYDAIRQYHGFTFDLNGVIEGIKHVLRPGGVCVWVVGDQMVKGSETGTSFKMALAFIEHGMLLHDTMIYRKLSPVPNVTNDKVRYHQAFEYMFCFSKGKPTTFNPIMTECKYAGNENPRATYRAHGKDKLVKRPKIVGSHKVADNIFGYHTGSTTTTTYRQAFEHPAVYPEKLARDQIISWTDEGDVVLDPMCGSGTTIFCASVLGRKSIGIDISQRYINLTRQRLEEQPTPGWTSDGHERFGASDCSAAEASGGQMTLDFKDVGE